MAFLFVFVSENAKAQAASYLNIGVVGASLEFPIADDVTIAPFAATNLGVDYLTAGVKVNYYFDNMLGLPSEFDFYGGANAGYAFGINDTFVDDFDLGLQIGFRWFWSDKMGLYLEGAGGIQGVSPGLGLTIRL